MNSEAKFVRVDGKDFKILSHDAEMIQANTRPGMPHIWHGVASDGSLGIFASTTERTEQGHFKSATSHRIM